MLERFAENPIIEPSHVAPSREDFEVVCTLNAGAIQMPDGTVLLLMRVAERPKDVRQGWATAPLLDLTRDDRQITLLRCRTDDAEYDPVDPRWFIYQGQKYLTSISHLRVARSQDGRRFQIDPTPTLVAERACEEFGVEDPRITYLEGRYWITYTAVSRHGIATALASTEDFHEFQRHGVIFCPENRDVTIFPERIGGRYACHHRPVPVNIGQASMWVAWSDDLMHWGDHGYLMGGRPDTWDSGRIGGGAVPIKTERGWLAVYHGADHQNRYCLGAVLVDLDDPGRVLARSREPLMAPQADYEVHGFFGNVVFSSGAVLTDDVLTIYYGAADRCLAGATVPLQDVLGQLEPV